MRLAIAHVLAMLAVGFLLRCHSFDTWFVSLDDGIALPTRSLIRKEVILICRKQQCSEGIPHSDDFAHSKVSESLLIGFLGSLESLRNSEQVRIVVYGFPKFDFKGRSHLVSRAVLGRIGP
jgi:hypothetical protein